MNPHDLLAGLERLKAISSNINGLDDRLGTKLLEMKRDRFLELLNTVTERLIMRGLYNPALFGGLSETIVLMSITPTKTKNKGFTGWPSLAPAFNIRDSVESIGETAITRIEKMIHFVYYDDFTERINAVRDGIPLGRLDEFIDMDVIGFVFILIKRKSELLDIIGLDTSATITEIRLSQYIEVYKTRIRNKDIEWNMKVDAIEVILTRAKKFISDGDWDRFLDLFFKKR